MKYISGGYYIVSPLERADCMDKALLPETIISASECLCDFYPKTLQKINKQNYSKALSLSKRSFEEM